MSNPKIEPKEEIRLCRRFAHVNIITYAFQIVKEFVSPKPKSFLKAMATEESKSWQAAMEEEVKTLDNNNT